MLIDKEVFIHLSIHCLETQKDVWSLLQWTLHIGKEKHNGLTYLCTNLKERKVLRYISTTYFHCVILITKEAFCQRFVVSLSVHPQTCIILFIQDIQNRVCNFANILYGNEAGYANGFLP